MSVNPICLDLNLASTSDPWPSDPWITLLACDKNTTGASIGDDIFTLVRNRGAIAAMRYLFFSLLPRSSSPRTSPSSHISLIFTSVARSILATSPDLLDPPWKSQTPVSWPDKIGSTSTFTMRVHPLSTIPCRVYQVSTVVYVPYGMGISGVSP